MSLLSLPRTLAFCLGDHRLLFFKSENFTRLCLMVDHSLSVSFGTLCLSFCKCTCYFFIFLIIPLNIFLFHFFGSFHQDSNNVCADTPLTGSSHFPLFAHLPLSRPLNHMPCSTSFLSFFNMAFIFTVLLFFSLISHISSVPQPRVASSSSTDSTALEEDERLGVLRT